MSATLLEVRDLVRIYRTVEGSRVTSEQTLFRGLSLEVAAGEFVGLVGASGCGKSTLLNLIGGLDSVDRREHSMAHGADRREGRARIAVVEGAGSIRVDGFDIGRAKGDPRADFINRNIGFVFQLHHLIPELSALENVVLPVLLQGHGWGKARAAALEMLDRVGMGEHAPKRPAVLSGGERQRVAIARALVNRPRLVLADEPTGSLDPARKQGILDLLLDLNRALGTTIMMVTHDRSVMYDSAGHLRISRVIELERLTQVSFDEGTSPGAQRAQETRS